MVKFTIELPETETLFTGDDRQSVGVIEFKRFTPEFIADAFPRALRVVAMNAYNSGGSKAKPHEKKAQLEKRLNSWYEGNWAIVERGEGIYTALRDEVFIPLCLESGMTLKQAESLIRDKVKEYFPPDTKATFANFIEATAIERKAEFGGDVSAAKAAIEAYYEAQLATRREARAKAESKVAMPKIDLAAFKKAAK